MTRIQLNNVGIDYVEYVANSDDYNVYVADVLVATHMHTKTAALKRLEKIIEEYRDSDSLIASSNQEDTP